ncbi:hypothetical protein [Trichloromonas sp.]|uniref:hypothetical protein n=1 Tax=Trichloromonas sp. TaxID=3069249 RepID=UPI002A3E7800|nr:hypothetical protein [Trichloromonas sp.]
MTLNGLDNASIDKDYIQSLIQSILDNNHSLPQKRKIRVYPDRLNFSCPICGDSEKVASKKRGNLYFKNMMYICFNEETCSRSFTKLLDTFNIQMDIEKKIQMYQYIENNIQFQSNDEITIKSLDKLFDVNDLCEFFKRDKTRNLTNLQPLVRNSGVDMYVRNVRNIKFTRDIYEGVYHFNSKWSQPVMVFLNRMGDNVISMQIRNLLNGDKRYFKIMDFSYIYDMMYPDGDLDDQERISYNKLSHFFNIFNVDFTRDVNLFEGYIDSLSIPNSIGQIGINTDIGFLLNEDGISLRFIYDNDKAGFNKSQKMLKDGHKVFLWNKFFIDLLKKHKGNKKELAKKLKEEIKDFNKLSQKFKKPLYEIFNFDQYFSDDNLDKIYFMDLDNLLGMI